MNISDFTKITPSTLIPKENLYCFFYYKDQEFRCAIGIINNKKNKFYIPKLRKSYDCSKEKNCIKVKMKSGTKMAFPITIEPATKKVFYNYGPEYNVTFKIMPKYLTNINYQCYADKNEPQLNNDGMFVRGFKDFETWIAEDIYNLISKNKQTCEDKYLPGDKYF